jgi:two-component system sensor histidine kinase ChiS
MNGLIADNQLNTNTDIPKDTKVLIIDDNKDKRELLAFILRRQDLIVMEADSGQKALKLVRKIKPDIILLDILMPGMNGYDVCSNLKSDPNLADVPVLFVTVLDQDQSRIKGLRMGGDDFITWPLNANELIARVNARIRSHRPIVNLRRTVQQQASLLQEERRDKEETSFELERARLIQQRLLSVEFPDGFGVAFSEYCRPSRKVGGDFYDVMPANAGEIFVIMADVSGHGIPAAMLTGLLKVLFRTGVQDHGEPGRFLQWLNTEIARYLSAGEFLTAFVGLWKASGRRFRFAGAGHPPALLIASDGTQVDRLNVPEGVVGVTMERNFTQKEIVLSLGQRLVCYTDGITEAMNRNQTLFGEDRLANVCAHAMDHPLSEMVRIVFKEVDQFSDGTSQQDDQAVLAMEVVA